MSQAQRITHIDSLRGAAVLLMVMVHAAATWNPFQGTQQSILAYVISGLGGLAAPLFVTLFGWGIIRSQLGLKQRMLQSLFLFSTQILVNMTSPHLFHLFTPGILSLFGLLTLILPSFTNRIQSHGMQLLLIAITLIFATQYFFPELQGAGIWTERISDDTPSTILSNMLFTGTYPLFPWIIFAILGATISGMQPSPNTTLTTNPSMKYTLGFGLLFCSITFLHSYFNNALWAHPTNADAYLTFFPANTAFIIAAFTGVLIIWYIIQAYEFEYLNSTGKISLTIYLIHFIPLSLMQNYEDIYQWGLGPSALAVLLYTIAWIPISAQWLKYWPKINAETVLRKLRRTL
jgi:peptidoglycan/LPS O-acetylase OafA/YrhL